MFVLDSSHHRTKSGYLGNVTTVSHTEVMGGSLSTQLSPLLNCSFLLGDLFRYIPCIHFQDSSTNGNKAKNIISGSSRPMLSSNTIPAGSALGREGHHRVHTYEYMIQGTGLCGIDRAVWNSPKHPACALAHTTKPWDGKLLPLLCGYRLCRHLQIMA